ncbi:MAG: hypothetical protein KDB05_10535 [Planctomycetales bacterium]|nr:hypothetical protein [Planctomycetales bacterium]
MTRIAPILLAVFFSLVNCAGVFAQDELPLIFEEGFENGAELWEPTDAKAWKIKETDKGNVFSQFEKRSKYEPPHRSPYNMALLKDIHVSDFVLDADVLSTHEDYGHRDVCLFFGYQDPAHFYYVHLGKKTDDHANQIFVVNDAPRTKISTKTTPGTNWDEQWHHVRIVRDTSSGSIEIFYDDMKTPVMTATDKTFLWGRVGVGSFDDTGDWDNIKLRGLKAEKH